MGDGLQNKAIFLDRDGTINVEKNYLIDPTEFEFIPGVPQALKSLQSVGYLLIVVTNQSGIGRGFFSKEQVERLHQHMLDLLVREGVQIDAIYFCPHHPTAGDGDYLQDCDCRKGKPGMLLKAADELKIDLKRSFMVGDKKADLDAGLSAGCCPILVRTGYGTRWTESAQELDCYIVDDLPAAANFILSQDDVER